MKPTIGVPLCVRPSNEVQWELASKFLWSCAYRAARVFRYADNKELIGTVWLHFRTCLDYWSPTGGGSFATYLIWGLFTKCRTFVGQDSMRNGLYFRTKDERESCEWNQALHEETYFYLYRVPEKDEEWVAAVMELFDYDGNRLFEFLTRPLQPRQKELVILRFRDGWKHREIGERMGFSKQRAEQIERAALQAMRETVTKLDAILELFEVKP